MTDKPAQLRKRFNEVFLQELAKLNDQQRVAVQTIEGPVLVIAGPGTGKTHILSARIGQILMKTDTQPHNILCLTFTDAGAHAMRERLLDFIGPESHKVHIYTFHSFCNAIIQENLETFGRRDLEPISELERVELIRKIIDKIEDNHPLKQLKGDPYVQELRLKRLFDIIKSENFTVEDIEEAIDVYLADLPTREDYIYKKKSGKNVKGDLKQNKFDGEVEKMQKLRAAAKLFPHYKRLLDEHKRYDFGDMIRWVLDAFADDPQLLRRYQEQYLYILVDEFQDTNGSQSQITNLLTSYWDSPNIFVVGDDDQAIYEFQGARVKNILDYHNKYIDSISLILLKENYRSSQNILDASKALIDHNHLRLIHQLQQTLDKNLVAAGEEVINLVNKPKIIEFYNTDHEDMSIVLQIKDLQDQNVPLGEIAIIYAKHRQAQKIITLLQRKNIPYNTKRRVNVLELPLVQNILTLLKYIQQEYDLPHSGEETLFELLHFNFIGIAPQDIAKLTVFMARDKHLKIRAKEYDLILKWRGLLGNHKRLESFNLKSVEAIKRLDTLINTLLADYKNLTMTVLFERLINRSGLLRFVVEHNDKLWLMQVISTLFAFIQKETGKNPRLNIKKFLDIIARMESNRLSLGIIKALYAEDSVNLVTAHSAKGLEFKHVFILDAVEDTWEPSKRKWQTSFKLPDTLTLSEGAEDDMEAARRLFYVAMTRSKSFLQISYSGRNLAGKLRKRTKFIDEILANTDLVIESRHLSNDDIVASQILQLTEPIIPVNDRLPSDILDGLLEGFILSPTSLCRYLQCPLSFYYENVLRVPSASSEAAAYGSAVHYALKRLFDKMKVHETQEFPKEEEFMKDFERELERQKAYLSPQQYKRRLAFAKGILPNYYKAHVNKWSKTVDVELDVRNVEIKGVPIAGAVDKIEFLKNQQLQVVDYKTGKFKKDRVSPPTEKNPIGGHYWRQVIFYKLLLENYRNYDWKVISGEIEYIEPYKNKYVSQKISISRKDVEIVTKQITDSYEKIQGHEFFNGCGDKWCKWCNFVQRNIEADSYNDGLSEALDDE